MTLRDLKITHVPSETGASFAENATIKAKGYAGKSGLLTLADDSGLEVAALGGAPGIQSARYAGEGASDQDRINLLLSNLRSVPTEKRTARFVCVIALALPDGNVHLFTGECGGTIIFEARGTNGFGYDPVFYMPELGKTMAELSDDLKNQVSHRARAANQAREYLTKRARDGASQVLADDGTF